MSISPSGGWSRVRTRWNLYWFQPVPVEIFALLRITFGMLGLATLLGELPTSRYWWSTGVVPIPPPGGVGDAIVSSGLGNVAGELLFWWFAAAVTGMLLGYGSRIATLLTLAAANAQFVWNPLPLSGANAVFVVFLFCLVWAETGATWSIDAWLERRRRKEVSPLTKVQLAPILPLRLIQLQLALVYFNSGLMKIHDVAWRDGSALHWAMANNVFHRFPHPLPLMNETTLAILTYVTVFWELSFAFLLLNRWTRRAAILIGLMLHLGIWVTIEVGPFSPLMLAAYISFIDPRRIARWAGRLSPQPAPVTV